MKYGATAGLLKKGAKAGLAKAGLSAIAGPYAGLKLGPDMVGMDGSPPPTKVGIGVIVGGAETVGPIVGIGEILGDAETVGTIAPPFPVPFVFPLPLPFWPPFSFPLPLPFVLPSMPVGWGEMVGPIVGIMVGVADGVVVGAIVAMHSLALPKRSHPIEQGLSSPPSKHPEF